MRFLRDDPRCQFWNIVDVTAVDWPGSERRFDVVYHLLSPKQNRRVRVKIEPSRRHRSIRSWMYFSAPWFEREIYDLYGIVFTGHPDLRRLLTDYGFEGHPLRKDFPLSGFIEVRWTTTRRSGSFMSPCTDAGICNFDFLSPWEGTDYPLPGDEKAGKIGAAGVLRGCVDDEAFAQARADASRHLHGGGRQDRSLHAIRSRPRSPSMPKVFATGFMIVLMEWACTELIEPASRCRRRQRRGARRCEPSRGDPALFDRDRRRRVRGGRLASASPSRSARMTAPISSAKAATNASSSSWDKFNARLAAKAAKMLG